GVFEDRFPGDLSIVNRKFQKSRKEDARDAVRAAKRSFEPWRRTSFGSRCEIFEKAASIASRRKYELAAMMTLENGKNRTEALADIDELIDFMRFYADQMRINEGYAMDTPPPYPNERPKNLLRPFGVWSVVSPFNFPAAIMGGMSTGAMITGNTVVVKPASDTPWHAFALADILKEAGLPDGVFNVVTGPGGTVGQELVDNPGVSGFVFTGSRKVGMDAMGAFLKDGPRPFIAEMGGKNAVIVTARANIDEAVEGVGRAAFGFGGQKCSACSRVLVDRRIVGDFTRALKDWTEKQAVGDPRKRETLVGPVINESAVARYRKSVRLAEASGKIVTGGVVLAGKDIDGYYVQPTIVTGLKATSPLMVKELFLPFVCVHSVPSLGAALAIANSSEYGLTSGIMSRDDAEIERFMDQIEAGTIYSNRRLGASTAAIVGSQPFVGWKMSGTTCKAAGGRYYLPQFMREQSQTRCV
ncbi:MAG TPA: aldehyde dehydrogenase family protein, partial [Thermoplasmata archaeon]|nr:aldehyde dehydrogenase family protein [Thermoplasmata archaeon]